MMKKSTILPLIFVLPLLASCSTAMEGATQQVSFKTIGADDALCNIQTGSHDYRYDVRPPQSLWIQKSRKPMFISCTAPGNRVQNITVESTVAGTTYLNTLNAGLGAGWDAESGAMYKYPEEIVIDFSGVPTKEQALPSYMNNGALDAKTQGIEYMGPESPALDEDKVTTERYKAAYEEDARMRTEKAAFDAEKERRINAVEGGFYGDKGGQTDAGNGSSVIIDKNALPPVTSYTPPKTRPAELIDTPPQPVAPAGSPAVVIPQSSTLGKPLFPSTTSF